MTWIKWVLTDSSMIRETVPNRATDACRLHGVLHLTKVAGNFHITAGKVLPLPMLAHAHIAPFLDDEKFNYSHRINQFSFGPKMVGLVHPLEGDEIVTDQGSFYESQGKDESQNGDVMNWLVERFRLDDVPVFRHCGSHWNWIASIRFFRNTWLIADLAVFRA